MRRSSPPGTDQSSGTLGWLKASMDLLSQASSLEREQPGVQLGLHWIW